MIVACWERFALGNFPPIRPWRQPRHGSYGTYRFALATDLSRLTSSLTLGMFLWSDGEDFAIGR